MNKQELIEKYVYMKRNLEMWVCTPDILKDLKQLDEPKKVKIPEFVANWLEYSKIHIYLFARALMIKETDFYNYANQNDHFQLVDF